MQIIELKNDFSLLIALWAGNKQNKTKHLCLMYCKVKKQCVQKCIVRYYLCI